MKPASVSLSDSIGAPVERVFELLTDSARLREWYPGCDGVVRRQGGRGKGERWTLRIKTTNRVADLQIEVIDYTPPTSFGWIELAPRAGSKIFFRLEFSGGATRITMKEIWIPKTLRGWVRGKLLRRRNAHRVFDGMI